MSNNIYKKNSNRKRKSMTTSYYKNEKIFSCTLIFNDCVALKFIKNSVAELIFNDCVALKFIKNSVAELIFNDCVALNSSKIL